VRPPDDEVSQGFRRGDLAEITDPRAEEPTAEVDLGGGRKLRLNLPQLPPGLWVVISLLMGGSGTAVGTVMGQDWLGLRARAELARVQCDLELARCGCSVAPEATP
jgi:hypothetical protein